MNEGEHIEPVDDGVQLFLVREGCRPVRITQTLPHGVMLRTRAVEAIKRQFEVQQLPLTRAMCLHLINEYETQPYERER